MLVDGAYHRREEEHELQIVFKILARFEQILAVGRGYRPVVVLARSVDALEGFFVQQAYEPVPRRYLAHDRHRQLVVVGRYIDRGIYRRELVLTGRDLVVTGLGVYAELPQFSVKLLHKAEDIDLDYAEVMILEFLSLRRARAEQRPARNYQIGAFFVQLARYKEVFLFRSDGRHDALGRFAEQLEHA